MRFFPAPFCNWRPAVPVQEGVTAVTRCFGEVSVFHARVQGSSSNGWQKAGFRRNDWPPRLAGAVNIGGAGEGKTKRTRHSTGPAASEEANELGSLGSSGLQPHVQGQSAGTSASASARDRCVF